MIDLKLPLCRNSVQRCKSVNVFFFLTIFSTAVKAGVPCLIHFFFLICCLVLYSIALLFCPRFVSYCQVSLFVLVLLASSDFGALFDP